MVKPTTLRILKTDDLGFRSRRAAPEPNLADVLKVHLIHRTLVSFLSEVRDLVNVSRYSCRDQTAPKRLRKMENVVVRGGTVTAESFDGASEMFSVLDRLELDSVTLLSPISEVLNKFRYVHSIILRRITGMSKLLTVDVENFPVLTHLEVTDCSGLKLIQSNVDLHGLVIENCPDYVGLFGDLPESLRILKLNGCPALKELPDLSDCCTELIELGCRSMGLRTLDPSLLENLQRLDCSDNRLQTLDTSACRDLEELRCSGNLLRRLDLSYPDTSLRILDASRNLFTGMAGLGHLYNLEEVDLSGNRLEGSIGHRDLPSASVVRLDVSGNPNLQTLDTVSCTTLRHLACNDCGLTRLRVDGNVRFLNCKNNKLQRLRLDENFDLRRVECTGNLQGLKLYIDNFGDLEELNCDQDTVIYYSNV